MDQKEMLLEGLSLNSVWAFICIGFALIGVFLVIAKAIDQIRKWIKEHKQKKELGKKDITDDIADKVMEKLTPQIDQQFDTFSRSIDKKFEDIDKKLGADKELLASHTTQLNDHEGRVSKLEGGNLALCHGMLALLERDPSLTKEQRAMKNYLIDGKYKEDDWK